MAGVLVMLMGIPGCGKSTYAKEVLLKEHPDWKYVSRDEVRYEYVHDQAHYFDHETEVYREFCNRITMHLQRNCTVIADATHLNEASRQKLMRTLSEKPEEVFVIYLDTPFDVCVERNNQREGITKVPINQMFRMKRAMKLPLTGRESYVTDIFVVKYKG